MQYIVTEAANSVLMFEAGEQAALMIKTLKIEDVNREFEKRGYPQPLLKYRKKSNIPCKRFALFRVINAGTAIF